MKEQVEKVIKISRFETNLIKLNDYNTNVPKSPLQFQIIDKCTVFANKYPKLLNLQ